MEFEEITRRFPKAKYYEDIYQLLYTEVNAENKVPNNFVFIAIKVNLGDSNIIEMISKFSDDQRRILWEMTDQDGNKLLHLATKFQKHELIQYLGDMPVDEKHKNKLGHTALHVAVIHGNVDTLKVLLQYFEHRGIEVNEKTGDYETALHLAAKKCSLEDSTEHSTKDSKEMIKHLVESGANIVEQDSVGNTPLHDLLQLIHLKGKKDPEKRRRIFGDVWDTIMDVSVIWWSYVLQISIPDEELDSYQEMRRDAAYCIRSLVNNDDELSVLEYAAILELPELVQIMLTQKNIFVVRKKKDDASYQVNHKDGGCHGQVGPELTEGQHNGKNRNQVEYQIEVSNLMPEYSCEIQGKTKYSKPEYFKDLTLILNRSTREVPESFLKTLSKTKPPEKVHNIFGAFPMDMLARYQWHLYQWFILVGFLVHTVMMSLFTVESQTSFGNSSGNSSETYNVSCMEKTFPNKPNTDILLMVYAFGVGFVRICMYVRSEVRGGISTDAKLKYAEGEKAMLEYVKDKTTILNNITYAVALVVELFGLVVHTVFSICSIVVVCANQLGFTPMQYSTVKGITLLSGWIIIPILLRSYYHFHTYIVMLKHIFVRCMLPYILFYTFLSIAFGCAIQLQFQLLSDIRLKSLIVEDGNEMEDDCSTTEITDLIKNVSNVVWQLCVMVVSLDTKLKDVQLVGYLFHVEGHSSYFIEFLIFLYGLLVILLLLNMLIAAMNIKYTKVLEKQSKGWWQYQVHVYFVYLSLNYQIKSKQGLRSKSTYCYLSI